MHKYRRQSMPVKMGYPMEYTGTTNSILFEFWFENFLMLEVGKGYVIILDNATFHRRSVLPELARHYSCEDLFLPSYSPDLNAIEKKWAWLKRTLRSILYYIALVSWTLLPKMLFKLIDHSLHIAAAIISLVAVFFCKKPAWPLPYGFLSLKQS